MSSQHKPGVYSKGDTNRVAATSADAVGLVFDGYIFEGDLPDEVAKDFGVDDSEKSDKSSEASNPAAPDTSEGQVSQDDAPPAPATSSF
jgi:hypothetical protein